MRLDMTLLGAVEDEDLLGLVGYARARGVVDIDRPAVEPAHFRRGVGRRLLDEVHRREAAARRIEVSTGAANHPASALYASMGNRLTGHESPPGVRLAHFARPVQAELHLP